MKIFNNLSVKLKENFKSRFSRDMSASIINKFVKRLKLKYAEIDARISLIFSPEEYEVFTLTSTTRHLSRLKRMFDSASP